MIFFIYFGEQKHSFGSFFKWSTPPFQTKMSPENSNLYILHSFELGKKKSIELFIVINKV